MTIFIKAAKKLMLQCLDDSMDEASAKNKGLFGGFRNSELSSEQKDWTLKLRKFIQEYNADENDEKSIAIIRAQITEIDSGVELTRRKYEFPRGKLNETLTKMNSDVERFYNTISTLAFRLNDIADDKNPFHILCSHAAYYFGENIFDPHDEGVFAKTVTSLVGGSAVSIREHKEACLLNHLKECERKLKAVKDGDEFDGMRKELVLHEVEAIQRENAEICKQAQPITTIPVSLSFFATANLKAPTLKPSRGRLELCMKHVIDEISTLDTKTPAAAY